MPFLLPQCVDGYRAVHVLSMSFVCTLAPFLHGSGFGMKLQLGGVGGDTLIGVCELHMFYLVMVHHQGKATIERMGA